MSSASSACRTTAPSLFLEEISRFKILIRTNVNTAAMMCAPQGKTEIVRRFKIRGASSATPTKEIKEMRGDRFDDVLGSITRGVQRERIPDALVASDIANADDLKDIVRGMSKSDAMGIFQRPPLSLSTYDAAALAGLVLSWNRPQGTVTPLQIYLLTPLLSLL